MKSAWKNRISMIAKESDLLKTCLDYLDILKAQGKVYYACVADSKERVRDVGSMPDLIVWIRKGISEFDGSIVDYEIKILSFELKSPKGTGKLTGRQQEFMAFLEGCDHTHHITNDFDIFKNILDNQWQL